MMLILIAHVRGQIFWSSRYLDTTEVACAAVPAPRKGEMLDVVRYLTKVSFS
jgi:hypothetical protein